MQLIHLLSIFHFFSSKRVKLSLKKAGSDREEFLTTWDFGMAGSELNFWCVLSPTCCFSSGLGGNLLKHIKLHVATLSLLVPAAVATECQPCSQVFFFFYTSFLALSADKTCCARWGEEIMTLPLAQEPLEISAAMHLCCIFEHRNREVVTWCDLTNTDGVPPSTRWWENYFFWKTGTKL